MADAFHLSQTGYSILSEKYCFQAGALPPGYKPEFEISLFNNEKHRSLQSSGNWQSFYILNQKSKRISAAMHFHVYGNLAQSPLRSPFGSMEFSKEVSAELIFDFLKFVEASLKEQSISRIVIKNYPQAYAKDQSVLLHTFLVKLGYTIAKAEVGSVIEITPGPIRKFFHRSARRRLDKAKNAGLIVKKFGIRRSTEVFTFIQQCRAEKQYCCSMSLADFQKTVNLFPNHYVSFGVFDGHQLVAASITIRVKKNILYDFYHDHVSSYDHLSPVVLLVSAIYEFCQDKNIELLDLGTSTLNSAPNFSLLHFKKSLGCQFTSKLTFEKMIN
jgi:hypothetical protein